MIVNVKDKSISIGLRIPKKYFIAKGSGESNITVHAGSYHLALKNAGIEMCNIMTYSSIMPKIAQEIKKPKKLVHGCVMETISAVATSNKGERATASIIFGWLYNKKTKEKYGGIVCEYNGMKTAKEAEKELKQSINELYKIGYSEKFDLKDMKFITKSFVPKKKYGTAIVALCFTEHEIPIVKK